MTRSGSMSADDPDRQSRLAVALRANLRRRKGQARERAAGDDTRAPEGPEPSPPEKSADREI
jgi:hypothetical protein